MSNEDNKTHGGKGVNTPKPEADKNYRDNFGDIDFSKDAKGEPRMNRQGTQAMPCVEFAGGG